MLSIDRRGNLIKGQSLYYYFLSAQKKLETKVEFEPQPPSPILPARQSQ